MPYADKRDLYEAQVQRWIDRKIRAIHYLGGRCVDCAGAFPYPAMQFVAKPGQQRELEWKLLRIRPWVEILQHLDRCHLICANCNAVRNSRESARLGSNQRPIA